MGYKIELWRLLGANTWHNLIQSLLTFREQLDENIIHEAKYTIKSFRLITYLLTGWLHNQLKSDQETWQNDKTL